MGWLFIDTLSTTAVEENQMTRKVITYGELLNGWVVVVVVVMVAVVVAVVVVSICFSFFLSSFIFRFIFVPCVLYYLVIYSLINSFFIYNLSIRLFIHSFLSVRSPWLHYVSAICLFVILNSIRLG